MDTSAPALPPIVIGKAPSRSQIITNLLSRPEGATRAELISALRWPSINVPKEVANLGLAVTKTFRNGVPVFHASAPTETPVTDNVVTFPAPVVEPEPLASEPPMQAAPPNKSRLLRLLAMRPQGVTRAEAFEATGWKSVQPARRISAKGYKTTKKTRDGVVVYFLRPIVPAAEPLASEPPVQAAPPNKNRQLQLLAMRPQGVTRAEALEATGWKGVNLVRHISAEGYKTTKKTRDGVPVYFLRPIVPAAEPSPIQDAPDPPQSAPEAQPSRARLVSEFVRLGVELMENGDRSPLKILESVLDS
jgi:hypothetical protein